MSASLVRATVRAVSKRKLQPTRAALTLTPSAVNKIKQLIKDKPEHVGVKVGVRTRGCNGLSYTLEYTKTKGDSDEEVVQDGHPRPGTASEGPMRQREEAASPSVRRLARTRAAGQGPRSGSPPPHAQ
ncbi:iron-sulfur cluster assembly 1 homolog, mitochondrial isoform X2 [Manis javanica]|uniref:iron-sulfur cluster assembly 1 homolog, mitochondrial isoform X2 n=1 Tax=Manis javanica TaxID=9974 RepID=UPI003C6CD0E1